LVRLNLLSSILIFAHSLKEKFELKLVLCPPTLSDLGLIGLGNGFSKENGDSKEDDDEFDDEHAFEDDDELPDGYESIKSFKLISNRLKVSDNA
jgi:hypothetical protein